MAGVDAPAAVVIQPGPGTAVAGSLLLRSLRPIGTGHVRLVYRHPVDPGLVVKVIRSDHLESKWGAGGRWYRRRSRLRQYSGFLRELNEYLALRARCPHGELPLARVVGLVDTDLGLGLVSELIELDGQPAPTLTTLVARRGFGTELRMAVRELVDRLLDCNVVVTDLRGDNLLARRHPDGQLQLVLVDGFGDKTIIPRLAISPWLNRRNTRRRALRLLRQLAGTG